MGMANSTANVESNLANELRNRLLRELTDFESLVLREKKSGRVRITTIALREEDDIALSFIADKSGLKKQTLTSKAINDFIKRFGVFIVDMDMDKYVR